MGFPKKWVGGCWPGSKCPPPVPRGSPSEWMAGSGRGRRRAAAAPAERGRRTSGGSRRGTAGGPAPQAGRPGIPEGRCHAPGKPRLGCLGRGSGCLRNAMCESFHPLCVCACYCFCASVEHFSDPICFWGFHSNVDMPCPQGVRWTAVRPNSDFELGIYISNGPAGFFCEIFLISPVWKLALKVRKACLPGAAPNPDTAGPAPHRGTRGRALPRPGLAGAGLAAATAAAVGAGDRLSRGNHGRAAGGAVGRLATGSGDALGPLSCSFVV